ncbi:hypothetical protein K432DRAFT_383929 [Lepidopterella palustris CBS 459.81]|uniref:Uncharacterized protein n=1 Tax=Lepidopterella palustris CBS 459.81 TaxID=1314670 RepID=A0A8E2E6T8_9PEZI|nr:hypothetical protein K432DRAFT_383929 [Lepidopterella palustris CBS 459.81]
MELSDRTLTILTSPHPSDNRSMTVPQNVEASAETQDMLQSPDASSYADFLRASTTNFYRGIETNLDYSYVRMRTEDLIRHVWSLARLPNGYNHAFELLVWFSINILHRRKDSCFGRLLNSQCLSIYWLLDDALLYIALERWEHDVEDWDVKETIAEIQNGKMKIPHWERSSYFTKSLEFLMESQAVFDTRSKVTLVTGRMLPMELVDEISGYLLRELHLPTGDLKALHDWRTK